MQVKGIVEICEWCGRKYFRPYIKTDVRDGGYSRDDYYEKLPEGWKPRHELGMLCPDCNKALDESINAAKSKCTSPAKTAGQAKRMVPLDKLKQSADLCIGWGWSLEQFRENMDEWDGDDVSTTETE